MQFINILCSLCSIYRFVEFIKHVEFMHCIKALLGLKLETTRFKFGSLTDCSH